MIKNQLLFETLYHELKRIAQQRLRAFPVGGTLHATWLVHEVYLRFLAKRLRESNRAYPPNGSSGQREGESPEWPSRGAFFAACSEAMRRIIIDHHRHKLAQKRGGRHHRVPLESVSLGSPLPVPDLLDVEAALQSLELSDPIKAEIVKLRFYGGMTMSEVAAALNISLATVERHWRVARARIAEMLQHSPEETAT